MGHETMRSKRWLRILAGGFSGLLVASQSARAAYDFRADVGPSSHTFGDTTTILLTGNQFGGLEGTNTVNLADLSVNSVTSSLLGDTINEPYVLQLWITDPADPGKMALFRITGELTGTASSNHENLDNTYLSVTPASQTIGSERFQLSVGPLGVPNVYFAPADINGGPDGNLGAKIIVTPVPEPAGWSLFICAAAGLLLLRRPRRVT